MNCDDAHREIKNKQNKLNTYWEKKLSFPTLPPPPSPEYIISLVHLQTHLSLSLSLSFPSPYFNPFLALPISLSLYLDSVALSLYAYLSIYLHIYWLSVYISIYKSTNLLLIKFSRHSWCLYYHHIFFCTTLLKSWLPEDKLRGGWADYRKTFSSLDSNWHEIHWEKDMFTVLFVGSPPRSPQKITFSGRRLP